MLKVENVIIISKGQLEDWEQFMLDNIRALHGEKLRTIVMVALPEAHDAPAYTGYFRANTADKYAAIANINADIIDDVLAANIGRYLADLDYEPDDDDEGEEEN